ncbi:hypothetical protein BDV97DRAFT_372356 [Delphinella strobiligena]|nr:hypothetical protein BDV97DRAFT_372356 [Delphinella strobiligena]
MDTSTNDNAHPAPAPAVAIPRKRGTGRSSKAVSVVNTEGSIDNEAAQASAGVVSAPKAPTKGKGRPRADGQFPYHHGAGPAPAGYRNLPDGHPKVLAKRQQASQQGIQEKFQDQDFSVRQILHKSKAQALHNTRDEAQGQGRDQDQTVEEESGKNQDQIEEKKEKQEVQRDGRREQPLLDITCKQHLDDLYNSRDQSFDAVVSTGLGGVKMFPVHKVILLANCNIRQMLILKNDASMEFGVGVEEFRDGRIFEPVLGSLYQQKYTNYSHMPLPWHVAVYRAAHVVKLPNLTDDVVEFIRGWKPRLGATRRVDMEILIVAMMATFTESKYDPSQRLQMMMARMALRNLDELRRIPGFKQVLTTDCGFMGKELAEAVDGRERLRPIDLVQCPRPQCKQYFPLGHVATCTRCGMSGGDWSREVVGKYIDGSPCERRGAYDLLQCSETDCGCFMPTYMFRDERGACVSCGTYKESWTKRRNERRWIGEPRFDLRFWDTRGQELITARPNLHQHCNCPRSSQN